MSKTEKLNKGLLSVNFVLEVIVDADGGKIFILREPSSMRVICMESDSSKVLSSIDEVIKTFTDKLNGVRQS